MNIQPCNKHLLIQIIRQKMIGQIALPDNLDKKMMIGMGRVVKESSDGKIEMSLVGRLVYFPTGAALPILNSADVEEKLCFVDEDNILGWEIEDKVVN